MAHAAIAEPVAPVGAPEDARARRRLEWPTWLVAAGVYGGFGLTTWNYHTLPWWLVLPLGAWFVTWHGSLQHEALHGHPTRWDWVNALLVYPSLWLWLPYPLYRESHLRHHRDRYLTCPVEDSESFYVTPDAWARAGAARRALLRVHNTVLGRLAIGPALAYVRLARDEARRLRASDHGHVVLWLGHVPAVAVVLYWALGVCGIPLWAYIAFFAYPGLSLTMLRSFAEHRPARAVGYRSAIVEAGPLMSLLYLNNNLHAVHHDRPAMAWYALPGLYRARRAEVLRANGGYVFRGYGEQLRRFLVRPKDEPVHPADTVAASG